MEKNLFANVSILWLIYYAVLKDILCLLGKLVDETGQYKYMYVACGAIVVLASVWLLIGNAINYRLLAKEKKLKETTKKIHTPESRESEPLKTSKSHDVIVKSIKSQKSKGSGVNPSERETNI